MRVMENDVGIRIFTIYLSRLTASGEIEMRPPLPLPLPLSLPLLSSNSLPSSAFGIPMYLLTLSLPESNDAIGGLYRIVIYIHTH